MIIENIHIGMLIKARVKKKGMTIMQFAQSIHKDRSGVYRIFNSPNIDTDLLIRISNILDYNFFAEYCVGDAYSRSCPCLIVTQEKDNWTVFPLPDELQDLIMSKLDNNLKKQI